MRYLAVILLALLFAPGISCDGNDDTSSDDGGDGGNGNGNGNGGGTPPVTIASGSIVAAGGTPVKEFMIAEPGTLKAVVSWSAPPPTLDIGFVHEGVLIDAPTTGSPATKTQAVTTAHVSTGPSWEFWIGNSGADVTVVYTVTFTPD